MLSAALPGLGVRRSLLLNLSGSAVANVVPLGGAVGTALNWRMVRRWGHSNAAFVAYCVLTNVLDVLTKLVLPLVAVAALVALSTHVPPVLWAMAAGCAAVVLVAAAGARRSLRAAAGPATSRTPAGRARLRAAGRSESGGRMREVLVRRLAAAAVRRASGTSPPRWCCSTSACTPSGSPHRWPSC